MAPTCDGTVQIFMDGSPDQFSGCCVQSGGGGFDRFLDFRIHLGGHCDEFRHELEPIIEDPLILGFPGKPII